MLPSSSKKIRPARQFVIAAALMVCVFWILTKWLSSQAGFEADPGEAERAALRLKVLSDLRAEEAAKLESFAWVDRAGGSVQIPIDLAMKLVLPELRANKPKPAYPIATPSPTPTANSPGNAGVLPTQIQRK